MESILRNKFHFREYKVPEVFRDEGDNSALSNYVYKICKNMEDAYINPSDNLVRMISIGDSSTKLFLESLITANGYNLVPEDFYRRSSKQIRSMITTGKIRSMFTIEQYRNGKMINNLMRQRNFEMAAKTINSLYFAQGLEGMEINDEDEKTYYILQEEIVSKIGCIDLRGIRINNSMIKAFKNTNPVSINLQGSDIVDEDLTILIKDMDSLESLDLSCLYGSRNYLKGMSFPHLCRLKNLKKLILPSFEGVSSEFIYLLRSIFYILSLQELKLGVITLDDDILDGIHMLKNLEKLTLDEDTNDRRLVDVFRIPNLKSLSVRNSNVTRLDFNPTLTELDISRCKVNIENLKIPLLCKLTISGYKLSVDGVKNIVESHPDITELDMSYCKLSYLPRQSSLTTLSLHGCKGLYEGVVRNIENYQSLNKLYLSYCEGIEFLDLSRLRYLSELEIMGLGIGDKTIKSLIELPLDTLACEENKTVTSEGWCMLSNIKSLKNLNLRMCRTVNDDVLNSLSKLSFKNLELDECTNITMEGISKINSIKLSLPDKFMEAEK